MRGEVRVDLSNKTIRDLKNASRGYRWYLLSNKIMCVLLLLSVIVGVRLNYLKAIEINKLEKQLDLTIKISNDLNKMIKKQDK